MSEDLKNSKLKLKSIYELLCNEERKAESFFIPSYQRGYRWTERQVIDLLNDVWDFISKPVKKENEWYCLQPIVVKKINEYYPEQLSGYTDVGIIKGSENHNRAIELLHNHNLPESILIEHVFDHDCVRLCVRNRYGLDEVHLSRRLNYFGGAVYQNEKLSEEQKNALRGIYDLYSNDVDKKQQNIKAFMSEWDRRPSLKKLREWWDQIPTVFTITSVGKVLAHSNAQRCDNSLPPLD